MNIQEEQLFSLEEADLEPVANILSSPDKIIIKTEITEEPQGFTGPKKKKRTKIVLEPEDLMTEEMPSEMPLMQGPAPMRFATPPPSPQQPEQQMVSNMNQMMPRMV